MKKYIFCLQFFLVSFLTRGQEVGSTEFNVADKIAINNVIDAYGFYYNYKSSRCRKRINI